MVGPLAASASSFAASKLLPAAVTVGAASAVITYVKVQLQTESNTMDKFFSSYNDPKSEAARQKVFDGAKEDPRTSMFNVLSWR